MGPATRSFLAILASLLLLAACGMPTSQARKPSHPASPSVVTFTVTGSDGGRGIDITYGSQNANLQGGSTLPWSTTMAIQAAAQYYDVQAQLNGAGSITCKVEVKGVTKTAHAAGGYDYCRAEVINDLNGRWIAEAS